MDLDRNVARRHARKYAPKVRLDGASDEQLAERFRRDVEVQVDQLVDSCGEAMDAFHEATERARQCSSARGARFWEACAQGCAARQ